jgi:hypothetical protein
MDVKNVIQDIIKMKLQSNALKKMKSKKLLVMIQIVMNAFQRNKAHANIAKKDTI